MLRRFLAIVVAAAFSACALSVEPALGDGPVITPGNGYVDTAIYVPGSPGTNRPIVQPVGGGQPDGSPAVTCSYTPFFNPGSLPQWPPPEELRNPLPGATGAYYFRSCTSGYAGVAFVTDQPAAAAGAAATVTPAQLALEARDRLVLARPAVHRSPTESNNYQGDHFTWAYLSTWFWTDKADYQPESQTVSVGPVSATVVARPVGLLFDPGDGSAAVRCPGPGRPWTDADGNDVPASGCGYQYKHVTDGTITSRLGILWRVAWTGTGATGGTLPTMETVTDAPLRVLQVQVVNR